MRRLTVGQSFFLDAVRFAAAAMVVQFHNLSFLFNLSGASHLTERHIPLLGFVGVTIFFILSGFVIAYTVSRKATAPGGYTLGTYLVERFSRIYAVLAPAVVVVTLIDILVEKRFFPTLETNTEPLNIAATLFLVNGFVPPGGSSGVAPIILGLEPVWSLTFEVCFYVVFGLVVLRAGFRRHPVARLAALAATLFFLSRLPYTALMACTWLAGVLGAHLFTREADTARVARRGLIGAALIAGAAAAALAGGLSPAHRQWAYIALLAAAFHALFVASGFLAVGPRLAGAAKFLASYSYSMYLLHYILLDVAYNILFDVRAVQRLGPAATGAFVLALFVGVNAICFLFSLATERQTPRLRRFLLGAPAAGAGAPSPT